MSTPGLLVPDWRVPDGVIARVSNRLGGVSPSPFDSFNLALHVDDARDKVLRNRRLLQSGLPAGMSLQWLEQVHGTVVVDADENAVERCGDAVYVEKRGMAGAVLTADCLPVFFASRSGQRVAVAHAGWRGLAAGILEKTLARFPDAGTDILVWLGPAIGPCHFEVGAEVRAAFLDACPNEISRQRLQELAFRPAQTGGKYFADLYVLARERLAECGVISVSGGGLCTFCDAEHYYSYRRNSRTGRFASLIGLAPDQG